MGRNGNGTIDPLAENDAHGLFLGAEGNSLNIMLRDVVSILAAKQKGGDIS